MNFIVTVTTTHGLFVGTARSRSPPVDADLHRRPRTRYGVAIVTVQAPRRRRDGELRRRHERSRRRSRSRSSRSTMCRASRRVPTRRCSRMRRRRAVTGWATARRLARRTSRGDRRLNFIVSERQQRACSRRSAGGRCPPAAVVHARRRTQFGSATVTVQIARQRWDGWTAASIRAAPQTFKIYVAVGERRADVHPDYIAHVKRGRGPQMFLPLTGASAGPSNENPALTITRCRINNSALFSAQPSINLVTGVLTTPPSRTPTERRRDGEGQR